MHIRKEIRNCLAKLRQHRQALHQIPELGLSTPKTQAYILSQTKLTYHELPAGILIIHPGREKSMIVFRCEMDGLDIQEENKLPWKSSQSMHACGHDGHMAAMLCLMELISQNKYHKSIGFLFQNGEESGHGAFKNVTAGLFEQFHIEAMIGFHIWPSLPVGMIGCKSQEIFAQSCEFKVILQGKAAHVSQAHEGIDALKLMLELYEQIIHIRTNPNVVSCIHIGHLESGTIMNQVADKAMMEGTIRCFDSETFDETITQIQRLSDTIKQRCLNCEVSFSLPYPVLFNDDRFVSLLEDICQEEYIEINKQLASDDFASYGQVPLLYYLVGCGQGNLHDPAFYYDEEILLKAMEIQMQLLENL